MSTRKELLERLYLFLAYFENNAKDNALFIPELETATAIYSIIEKETILSKKTVLQVIMHLNTLNNTVHYAGAGWYDYLLHLKTLLIKDGFNCKLTDGTLVLVN